MEMQEKKTENGELMRFLTTHFETLEYSINERFENLAHTINQRFDAVDKRFETIEQRLTSLEHRFDALEERVELGFASIELRLSRLEDEVADVKAKLERHLKSSAENHMVVVKDYEGLRKRIEKLEAQVQALSKQRAVTTH